MEKPRRIFLTGAAALITAGLVEPLQSAAWQKSGKKPAGAKPAQGKEEEDEDVSANEDLMREHGVLNRILLIYDEAGRRIGIEQPSLFSVDDLGTLHACGHSSPRAEPGSRTVGQGPLSTSGLLPVGIGEMRVRSRGFPRNQG